MKTQLLTLVALGMLGANLHGQGVSTVLTNLHEPNGVVVDADNTIYVSDSVANRILKYTSSCALTTLAGSSSGQSGANNGIGASASFNNPQGIILARGGLVVADSGNNLLRFISLSGSVSNLAGVPLTSGTNNGPANQALFRYPTGLAADAAGNIYIADKRNNAIRLLDTNNNVSTIATGFYQPGAVAVGTNGDVWVADTRNQVIKRIDSNLVVTVVAGALNATGTNDGNASDARFSSPSGVFFMGSSGLLISDRGNNTLRRLYFDSTPGVSNYVVTTVVGIPGQSGYLDSSPLASLLNQPIGLARDSLGGGFLIADSANNKIRRWQITAPLPPVSDPQLGWVNWVLNSAGVRLPQFVPAVNAMFTDDTVLAVESELATVTYITWGPTPTDPLNDTIPTPGPGVPGSFTAIPYASDGSAPTIVSPQPDITIKAISVQDGRPPSHVVSARFEYLAASPQINGDNPLLVTLTDTTPEADIYYTLDGSDPTNASTSIKYYGGSLNLTLASDVLVKARAFHKNYKPSDVVSKTLYRTNCIGNQLTFGFPTGQEASSAFIAAAGQTFYAPVTLTLLPAQKMYTLQFNVTATPIGSSPPLMQSASFQSMVEKPVPDVTPVVFTPIWPETVEWGTVSTWVTNVTSGGTNVVSTNVPGLVLTNLMFTDANYMPGYDLLGVGWNERYEKTNLYNTLSQDLIKYSRAHDDQLLSANGKVIVGGYSFRIPPAATNGQQYQIQLARASATSDGIRSNVVIQTPVGGSVTNGSINALKNVTVGSIPYIVGDVSAFRWYNAGDFGDGYLMADDVEQVFQTAIYGWNGPPTDTDFFDAMDSSDGTLNGLLDGNDLSINTITKGDGQLNIDDIYVTFRRSLDSNLFWYARFWSNGVRHAVQVPNVPPPGSAQPLVKAKPAAPQPLALTKSGPRSLSVTVDNLQAGPGQIIQVPIRANVVGDLPLRMMMMGVTVIPLDGSPALTTAIQYTVAASMGNPEYNSSKGTTNCAGVWMNPDASGLTGSNILAILTVSLPPNASSNSAYQVHFDHFSGSPNGLALFPTTVQDGMITLGSRHMSGSKPDLSTFVLRWPTAMYTQYIIESTPDLVNGNWTVVATNLSGDGTVQQFIDQNAGTGTKFYRVRAQQ